MDSKMIAASPAGLRAVVVRARAWARAQAVVPGPASVTLRPYWVVYGTRNAHARPVG